MARSRWSLPVEDLRLSGSSALSVHRRLFIALAYPAASSISSSRPDVFARHPLTWTALALVRQDLETLYLIQRFLPGESRHTQAPDGEIIAQYSLHGVCSLITPTDHRALPARASPSLHPAILTVSSSPVPPASSTSLAPASASTAAIQSFRARPFSSDSLGHVGPGLSRRYDGTIKSSTGWTEISKHGRMARNLMKTDGHAHTIITAYPRPLNRIPPDSAPLSRYPPHATNVPPQGGSRRAAFLACQDQHPSRIAHPGHAPRPSVVGRAGDASASSPRASSSRGGAMYDGEDGRRRATRRRVHQRSHWTVHTARPVHDCPQSPLSLVGTLFPRPYRLQPSTTLRSLRTPSSFIPQGALLDATADDARWTITSISATGHRARVGALADAACLRAEDAGLGISHRVR